MKALSLFPDDSKGAIIDPTGQFRYSLWRIWNNSGPRIVWIMLNPSTADAELDDPTIRRCVGFSKSWGAGSLEVVNLFAFRATDPSQLLRAGEPVGPENDNYILKALENSSTAIAAWGTNGQILSRDTYVSRLLSDYTLHCLGTTKGGHPRHPLYVPAACNPMLFQKN